MSISTVLHSYLLYLRIPFISNICVCSACVASFSRSDCLIAVAKSEDKQNSVVRERYGTFCMAFFSGIRDKKIVMDKMD
jgi:hypothetical protein